MAMPKCKHCDQLFMGKRGQVYCSLECAVWSRVDIRKPDECWPWTAAIGTHGYGVFDFSGEHFTSHTAVLLLESGVATKRSRGSHLVAMHSCDNRACCNPAHISAGTQRDNILDAGVKGRAVHIGPRGELSRTAILTAEDVLEIRGSPEPNSTLARRFGVKSCTIWQVRSRKSWKHI